MSMPRPTLSRMTAPGFFVQEGHCWRMVYDGREVGIETHCPKPPVWRGRFTNEQGRHWTVWSCAEHRAGLESVRPYLPSAA